MQNFDCLSILAIMVGLIILVVPPMVIGKIYDSDKIITTLVPSAVLSTIIIYISCLNGNISGITYFVLIILYMFQMISISVSSETGKMYSIILYLSMITYSIYLLI